MSDDHDNTDRENPPEIPTEKVRKDAPVYMYYKDQHPDPSLFPPNVRFIAEPGYPRVKRRHDPFSSGVTLQTEDGYERYDINWLGTPMPGETVKRGQFIGHTGSSVRYQHFEQLEPCGEPVAYTDKLGDPARDDYDKGH